MTDEPAPVMQRVQVARALLSDNQVVVMVRMLLPSGWLRFDVLPDNARVFAEALMNAADKADRRDGF